MRAYMESGFYILYLICICFVGIFLILKRKNLKAIILFGIACLLLGVGDAFHLVPRAVGLFTGTLDAPSKDLAVFLGIGKLVTSITMTAFYLLLYFFIYKRFDIKRNIVIDFVVYFLVLARIVLCALPQNGWVENSSPLIWGIIRNIPFVILGGIVIALSIYHLKDKKPYEFLYLAIILSFLFYIPVVIFAGTYSWVGMFMLPKTVCYLWIAYMGFADCRKQTKNNSKPIIKSVG